MVCPVCTVAVAAGVGILREFGVSDWITGMWFGALIVSSIAWMINWLDRKNIHFLFRKILVIVVFYALFILPLYPMHIISNPLLWGVLIGTFVFILSLLADKYLRSLNESKVMIKWQKVIIPIVFLTIASIVTHLIIKIIELK